MNELNNGNGKTLKILGMIAGAVIITTGAIFTLSALLNNKVDCEALEKHEIKNETSFNKINENIMEMKLMLRELMIRGDKK